MDVAQRPLTGVPVLVVRATLGALVLAALSAAGMLAITIDILAFANDAISPTIEPVDEYPRVADLETPARLATTLIWVVAGGLWAVWLWHLLQCAARLAPLRAAPALSVTLLFVPVVNWVVGKRAIDDAWRATGSRSGPLTKAWWSLTILFTVAMVTALVLTPVDAEYIEDQITAYRADAIAYGLAVVAATLGAAVTWRLSARTARVAATRLEPVAAAGDPRRDPARDAAGRAPLAIHAAGWIAWGSVGLALLYVALGATASIGSLSGDLLTVIDLAISGLVSTLMLIGLLFWLLWFYSAVSAYRAAHGGPAAGWLTAAWFVPPWMFFTPWLALGRLLDQGGVAGRSRRALRQAWAAYVLAVLASVPYAVLSVADDPYGSGWYPIIAALAFGITALGSFRLRTLTRAVAGSLAP